MSTTTKMAMLRRECDKPTSEAVRLRVERARDLGLLTSLGGVTYDGHEVFVALSPQHMHPADRGAFDCERAVAELCIDRAIATHRGPSEAPGEA